MGETVDNEKHNNKTRTRSSEKEALGIRARNVWLFPAALLRSPINRMYLPTHAETADRIQRRVCVGVYTPTCPEAHNGSRLLVQQPRIYPLLSTVCTRPSASTYTSTWSKNIYIYYIYTQVYQDRENSIRYTFPPLVFHHSILKLLISRSELISAGIAGPPVFPLLLTRQQRTMFLTRFIAFRPG